MTTHVRNAYDTYGASPLVVDGNGGAERVQVYRLGGAALTVTRADLKAALEKELGWTIITDPLPEVRVPFKGFIEARSDDGAVTRADVTARTPEQLRRNAAHDLALARWIEQHPPVDPKVEKLARLLEQAADIDTNDSLAEYLIENGVTVPE